MSTVSVTNVKNASSSVNNAVTTSGGDLTNAAGVSFMGGSKNLLYNGAMQVAQRGTSSTGITASGYFTADRWKIYANAVGTWTQTVENDAPTGTGLRRSLKMACTTASGALASNSVLTISQPLEGLDLQRVAKGTASAQQLMLSFWIKTSNTGTWIYELTDTDNSRQVSLNFTVSAANTWEKKTILFPADATGAFNNDNDASLEVTLWLSAGTVYTTGSLQSSWATLSNANRAVGQFNLASTIGNYVQITGCQLEVGPVATSFEFKSYGQELRECQRYYYQLVSTADARDTPLGNAYMFSGSDMRASIPLPVQMRAAPVLSATSGTGYYYFNGGNTADYFDSLTLLGASPKVAEVRNNSNMAGTTGHAGAIWATNVAAAVAFSAEL